MQRAVETTGAGDIFAACFFSKYYATKDPWAAARFAVRLASQSVTRRGMDSIPTDDVILAASIEILPAEQQL